jgi:hypothetical protein
MATPITSPLAGKPSTRKRTGRATIAAPDPMARPRDYVGPAAAPEISEATPAVDPSEAKFQAARDAVIERENADSAEELKRLTDEQAADAKADGINLEKGEDIDERPTDGLLEVPHWKLSATGDTENFAEAPALTKLAMHLIETVPEFKNLGKFKFKILWKAKGGTRAGEPRVTSTTLLGGIARYEAGAHFLITFAADHCRNLKMTEEQYEAAMDHALCHCGNIVNDDGTEKPRIRHGIEVFPGELKRRGLWRVDLVRINDVIQQKPLWEPSSVVSEGIF